MFSQYAMVEIFFYVFDSLYGNAFFQEYAFK